MTTKHICHLIATVLAGAAIAGGCGSPATTPSSGDTSTINDESSPGNPATPGEDGGVKLQAAPPPRPAPPL